MPRETEFNEVTALANYRVMVVNRLKRAPFVIIFRGYNQNLVTGGAVLQILRPAHHPVPLPGAPRFDR